MQAQSDRVESRYSGVPAPRVPVSDISFSRRTFGAWRLSFEVLLETRKPGQGMDLCADLGRVGLRVDKVTFAKRGCLHLLLTDEGSVEPDAIAEVFDEHSGVTILQWTNVISGARR